MDNKIYIEVSVLDDVFKLAQNLRLDDIREAAALNLKPEQALLRGFVLSEECYSVKFRGEVIGMFGVAKYNMPEGFGSVWFFGSDECTKHPFTFVRGGIEYTKSWLQKYDILINAVDSRNTSHISWLRSIGMTISNPIMINGFEFLQFYKLRSK